MTRRTDRGAPDRGAPDRGAPDRRAPGRVVAETARRRRYSSPVATTVPAFSLT